MDDVLVGRRQADLILGECQRVLLHLPDNCIDSIVTDPPYELGFMGSQWDKSGIANDPELWAQMCRVLKPGGHLLSFGGTRTHHRMWCAIEDGGFEIRDMITWLYGSGFPKSNNVARDIDDRLGAKREKIRIPLKDVRNHKSVKGGKGVAGGDRPFMERAREAGYHERDAGIDVTPEAHKWHGWGTGLKPAVEPIVVARKPLDGTVADNVLAHGTGAINVDANRVESEAARPTFDPTAAGGKATYGPGQLGGSQRAGSTGQGRHPPNVLISHMPTCEQVGRRVQAGDRRGRGQGGRQGGFVGTGAPTGTAEHCGPVYGDEVVLSWHCDPACPRGQLDAQVGPQRSGARRAAHTRHREEQRKVFGRWNDDGAPAYTEDADADTGSVSRFFPTFYYGGKAPPNERWFFCTDCSDAYPADHLERHGHGRDGWAHLIWHPTQKPLELIRWLVRLVTRPGGIVLDPFAGSATTGAASLAEGFRFLGIEMGRPFWRMGRRRLESDAPLFFQADNPCEVIE